MVDLLKQVHFTSYSEIHNYQSFTLNGIRASGSRGPFKGEAEPGALCQDTTNMSLYMNEGTPKLRPYWTPSSVYGNGGGFNGGARMVHYNIQMYSNNITIPLHNGGQYAVFGQGHNENGTWIG